MRKLALLAGLAAIGTAAMAHPATGWRWSLPPDVALPSVPSDNPMRAAKVELGRRLFYEADLSIDGTMSCATCHGQRDSFTDGAVTHPGVSGDPGLRNVPSLLNIAWISPVTWANPHLERLEQQVSVPIIGDDPIEMGMKGQEAEIVRRLGASACYPKMFRAAFPEDKGRIDLMTISKAIAAFERTIVSFDTAWDRSRTRAIPLSSPAIEGAELFAGKGGCATCHTGVNFTDRRLHPFATNPRDRGAVRATGIADDAGMFRTAGLRNVALTAPYLHDGSASTIGAAIARHGTSLSAVEEKAIVAFLDQLTDTSITTNPRLAAPPKRCTARS